MTATGLATALLVGVVLGSAAHLTMIRGRVPWWVTVCVGMGAVLLGTIVARLAGIGAREFSVAELVIQVVFGAAAVAIVAGTADRVPPGRHDRRV